MVDEEFGRLWAAENGHHAGERTVYDPEDRPCGTMWWIEPDYVYWVGRIGPHESEAACYAELGRMVRAIRQRVPALKDGRE